MRVAKWTLPAQLAVRRHGLFPDVLLGLDAVDAALAELLARDLSEGIGRTGPPRAGLVVEFRPSSSLLTAVTSQQPT